MPALGVIDLEYYSMNHNAPKVIELISSNTGFGYQNEAFTLSFENETECRSWYKSMRDKCVNGAEKKVFGMSLPALIGRNNHQITDNIPTVVHKCIRYIESKGRTVQ